MQNKNLGFDREQTLILQMPNDSVGDLAVKQMKWHNWPLWKA